MCFNCEQEAVNLRPTYADAYTGLGVSLKESKRKDEAEACFQQVVRLRPGCALSLGNLAGGSCASSVLLASSGAVQHAFAQGRLAEGPSHCLLCSHWQAAPVIGTIRVCAAVTDRCQAAGAQESTTSRASWTWRSRPTRRPSPASRSSRRLTTTWATLSGKLAAPMRLCRCAAHFPLCGGIHQDHARPTCQWFLNPASECIP